MIQNNIVAINTCISFTKCQVYKTWTYDIYLDIADVYFLMKVYKVLF